MIAAILLSLLLAESAQDLVSFVPEPVIVSFDVKYDDPAFASQETGVRIWRRVNRNVPTLIKLPANTRSYEDKNITQGTGDRTYCYRAQVATKKGNSPVAEREVCYTVKPPVVINLSTSVISSVILEDPK